VSDVASTTSLRRRQPPLRFASQTESGGNASEADEGEAPA